MEEKIKFPIYIHIIAICFMGIMIILPIAIYQKMTAPDPVDYRDGIAQWENNLKYLHDLQ